MHDGSADSNKMYIHSGVIILLIILAFQK